MSNDVGNESDDDDQEDSDSSENSSDDDDDDDDEEEDDDDDDDNGEHDLVIMGTVGLEKEKYRLGHTKVILLRFWSILS